MFRCPSLDFTLSSEFRQNQHFSSSLKTNNKLLLSDWTVRHSGSWLLFNHPPWDFTLASRFRQNQHSSGSLDPKYILFPTLQYEILDSGSCIIFDIIVDNQKNCITFRTLSEKSDFFYFDSCFINFIVRSNSQRFRILASV